MNNNKILLYQYGKVGSSSIRKSIESSKYVTKPLASYSSRLIQTHSHSVAAVSYTHLTLPTNREV